LASAAFFWCVNDRYSTATRCGGVTTISMAFTSAASHGAALPAEQQVCHECFAALQAGFPATSIQILCVARLYTQETRRQCRNIHFAALAPPVNHSIIIMLPISINAINPAPHRSGREKSITVCVSTALQHQTQLQLTSPPAVCRSGCPGRSTGGGLGTSLDPGHLLCWVTCWVLRSTTCTGTWSAAESSMADCSRWACRNAPRCGFV
jgi:hypothetical protein